jgi:hypothetical protein
MLFKLDIGRKLDGMSASRPGFLSSGVTIANLYLEGNEPRLKERLASVAISSEKTELHDFMRDVGMKSRGDDFGGKDDNIIRTSLGVTGSI